MGVFKNVFKKIVDYAKEPFLAVADNDNLREKNLDAVLQNKGITEFLKYRSYNEYDGTGIYTMSDWSKGLVVRLSPPPFLTSNTEEKITNFLSTIETDDTVVQFITYASQNITKQLQAYKDYHPCQSNISNSEILVDIINKRADSFQNWTENSMLKGLDFRVRDFHNLLVVLFPPEVEDDYVLRFFDSIKGSMGEFYPENYSSDDLLTLLREIFHREDGAESWNTEDDGLMELNSKITAGGIDITTHSDFQGIRMGGKEMARVFTTKSFPKDISLFEYNSIFFDRMGTSLKVPVPSPFLLSLTIRFEDVDKTKKAVLSRLSHDLGELGKLRPNTLKKMPDLKDRLKETEDQIIFMKQGGETPLNAMWTFTIFENDEKKLNEYSASIKQKFKEKDWELTEESSNNVALMTLLYSLPLQYSKRVEKFTRRFRVLFKSNNSAICPIIGDSRGAGEYNLLFIGRTGQLQRFDPYASGTNYNIVKVGSSGSGKSYSEADFHTNCLAAGYRIRIIDAGDSYKELCENIGGQYIEFTDESDVCLNFFTKVTTTTSKSGAKIIHEDEFSTIVPLIGLMGGVNLESTFSTSETIESSSTKKFVSSIVEQAVGKAFERREHEATLRDVRDIINEFRDKSLKEGATQEASIINKFVSALFPYADELGSFQSYFNGTNNVDMEKDYVVLEVEGLRNKGDMYQIAMMTLANQVSSEYFDPRNRGYRKLFGIDEAWMVFDNEIVVSFLESLYRKIRKSNGIASTIVQGIDDYFMNKSTAALYNNANWKWFLQQEDVSIDKAAKAGNVSASPFEIKLMKSIKNHPPQFGDSYIKSSETTIVARLKADSLSHWTFTNSPKDVEKVNAFAKRNNVSTKVARHGLALGFDGFDEETALMMAKQGLIKDINETQKLANANKVVEQALKNPSLITLHSQSIHALDSNEVLYKSIFPSVKNDMSISYADIIKNRYKIPSFEQFELLVVETILEKIADRRGMFSIGISLNGIMHGQVISAITEFVSDNEDLKDRLILEIPIAEMRKNEEAVVQNAIKEFRDKGILISNVGMKLSSKMGYVLSIDLDYVKIDKSLFSYEGESYAKPLLLAIDHMCKTKGIKLVAMDVRDEDVLEKIKKEYSEIAYAQGGALSEIVEFL